jgi:hypothetical protein
MLLLFPCPGTIPVPSCRPSCQTSRCVPPLYGYIEAASSRLSSAPTTTPMTSCRGGPTPSPSVSGRGMRSSPSAASRPAQKRTPHLEVRDAVADRWAPRRSRRHQPGLVCRPAGFSNFFSGAAMRRSRNRFPTQRRGFCTPRGGAFTASTDAVPVLSTGTATEVRPLTSSPSSRGQSSGGALWRAVYIPG